MLASAPLLVWQCSFSGASVMRHSDARRWVKVSAVSLHCETNDPRQPKTESLWFRSIFLLKISRFWFWYLSQFSVLCSFWHWVQFRFSGAAVSKAGFWFWFYLSLFPDVFISPVSTESVCKCPRVDTSLIFECSTRYLTSERSERVRY